MIYIQFRVESEIYRKIKAEAKARNTTLSEICREKMRLAYPTNFQIIGKKTGLESLYFKKKPDLKSENRAQKAKVCL